VETGSLLGIINGFVGSWLPKCRASYTTVSNFAVSKSKGVLFDDEHCNRKGS
jgi:hypothetical protein